MARDIYDEILHPEKALTLLREFADRNNIRCAEDIYQNDHIIANALELIEACCDAIGYAEAEDDDDITDGDFDPDNADYDDE